MKQISLTLNPKVRQSSLLNVCPTKQYTKKFSEELRIIVKWEIYCKETQKIAGLQWGLQFINKSMLLNSYTSNNIRAAWEQKKTKTMHNNTMLRLISFLCLRSEPNLKEMKLKISKYCTFNRNFFWSIQLYSETLVKVLWKP